MLQEIVLKRYPEDLAMRYIEALNCLRQSYQNFYNADKRYIDIASYNISLAVVKFDEVLKDLKTFNKSNTCKNSIFGV